MPVIAHKTMLLHKQKNYPQMELEFLNEAILEIVRCRQVLKHTYTFGFYSNMSIQQKNLFEHQQMLLEEACDLLHEQIEKPLDPFLDPNMTDRSDFFKFKSSLLNMTKITSSYYQKMTENLENQQD